MHTGNFYGDVPTWNGDPAAWVQFVANCKWYQKGLKPVERPQAASRIWRALQGTPKQVVQHLDPDDFDCPDFLEKLLRILKESPLQKMPLPDAFQKIDQYHHIQLEKDEMVTNLLVREQDSFQELAQALKRVREEVGEDDEPIRKKKQIDRSDKTSESDPVDKSKIYEDDDLEEGASVAGASSASSAAGEKDFFANELRGYRLLKAAQLSTVERQQVLSQTKNRTNFKLVHTVLRTLFAEDLPQGRGHFQGGGGKGKRSYWVEGDGGEEWDQEDWHQEGWQDNNDVYYNYYDDWSDNDVYWQAQEWDAYGSDGSLWYNGDEWNDY